MNNIFSLVMSRTFIGYTGQKFLQERALPNLSMIGTLIAIFSSCNTISRLAFGYCSDRFAKTLPRSFFLLVSCLLLLLVQTCLTFTSVVGIYPLIVLLGCGYGSGRFVFDFSEFVQ